MSRYLPLQWHVTEKQECHMCRDAAIMRREGSPYAVIAEVSFLSCTWYLFSTKIVAA